ncbi:MAG: hypothetical protein KC416_06140 [Myxococcales bacterium]|nr:hypothetical protein [Myxococcales bacterium]
MDPIQIDRSSWPLVVFTVPEFLSPDSIDLHFDNLKSEVFPRGRYASVMDCRLTQADQFDARLRSYAATRYEEHKAIFADLLISETYVLPSPFQRGVMTAIRWLAPAPWPTKNFARFGEAVVWSKDQIEQERASNAPSATV